jgi:hypothetical protein
MEKIKIHFEKLGYPINIEVLGNLIEMTCKEETSFMRFEQLCRYYFNDNILVQLEEKLQVDPKDFNPDGHGDSGICKICGCTEYDDCIDENGCTCWWEHDDLCSSCIKEKP